jgi:hypothetical protein
MKGPLLRWMPGLLIVAALSSATVAAITLPMRQSIDGLGDEAAALSMQQADAIGQLTQLQKAQAGSVAIPAEVLWFKGQSASVEIALQETLVSTASAVGLQLVSFGETTPPAEIAHSTLASELELVGTHEELGAFLASLEDTSPALAVSYLWLRQLPPDPSQTGSPLSIRMTVWGFRGTDETP